MSAPTMSINPIVKFQLLRADAKLPQYAHPDDAGFDIYSTEKKTLVPGERYVFQLGISSAIPEGYFVSFRDKSGLAAKYGLHTLAGVIDSGYRGEWGVVIVNTGTEPVTIEKGDKIAQGILQEAPRAKIIEVGKLSDTERGLGGFGSTGK